MEVMNPNELFIVASIIFFAVGLFLYWGSRLLILLSASEDEVNEVLDNDLAAARQIWLQICALFAPPQAFLLP